MTQNNTTTDAECHVNRDRGRIGRGRRISMVRNRAVSDSGDRHPLHLGNNEAPQCIGLVGLPERSTSDQRGEQRSPRHYDAKVESLAPSLLPMFRGTLDGSIGLASDPHSFSDTGPDSPKTRSLHCALGSAVDVHRLVQPHEAGLGPAGRDQDEGHRVTGDGLTSPRDGELLHPVEAQRGWTPFLIGQDLGDV